MKVGFIGINQLGKTLIEAFLHAQTFLPSEMIVYDRTKGKADFITTYYPGIFAAQHSRELIEEVSCFFLCIPDDEYHDIRKEIQRVVTPSQVLISLMQSIQVSDLEKDFPCKVAKIVTQFDHSKTYSYYTGKRMNGIEKDWLHDLFSTINLSQKNVTLYQI